MIYLKKTDTPLLYADAHCLYFHSLKIPIRKGWSVFVSDWIMRGDHIIQYGSIKIRKAEKPTIEVNECNWSKHKYFVCA